MSSGGMTKWIKELKPTRVDDLMAMVALFRPGPMAVIPDYIARKRDPSKVKYLDPRMEKYLGKSYGLLVYQDDLLFSAIYLAGYSWEEADKFRKAVGKKIPEEMALQKEKFIKGSLAGIFNQQSNFDIKNPFTVFSTRGLEDQLRPVAMQIILDFIWTRVRKDLKKRLLVLDEAWYLMKYQGEPSRSLTSVPLGLSWVPRSSTSRRQQSWPPEQ